MSSTTPQDPNEPGQYGAVDLQLAGLFVRAKVMLDGADQTLLRACIDAYLAANGIDAKAVERATLKILRGLQPVDFLKGLQQ